MESFFVLGHLDIFVELELSQVAVRKDLKDVDRKARKGAVNESPISSAKQYCTAQYSRMRGC
ncbi:hypothetical protein H5410_003704 [Solanum commersonii]|uniref:Uncharacterized protein n=1 Tax=Solanum commersonii TaxID=4109 RepID=A0A9J6B5U6_SOLCO|nr:hypothetical protein H5410_003704 [Solanum commersonii]